jgi:transcriptional regulator with XRE-family HTH domain
MRELREKRGLSRAELAAALDMSEPHIIKLENGQRAPSLALAWHLAQALGCSLDELTELPGAETVKRPPGRPASNKPVAASPTGRKPKRV